MYILQASTLAYFARANMFYNIDTKGLYHKTFYGCNL